ncbi:MAG TPA: hypothetical protein VMV18_07405 [bacterium]|nr:hypothetical protein [bacterium]
MNCHTLSVRILSLASALALAGCSTAIGAPRSSAPVTASTPSASAPAKFPVTIKDKTGTIEAHFDGETPPADLKAPLQFGTSRLWFAFAGDKTAYEFKPKGTLEFSDWFFAVFSPDGKWVLLPQDHYGPYHDVSVEHLKAYLQGKAQPDKVLQEKVAPGQQALVHTEAHWVSNDEVEYKAGGETLVTRREKIP